MTQPKKCLISDIYHVRHGVGSIGIMGSMPLTDMNYHDLRVSAITQAAHHCGGRRQAEMFDYQYDTSFLTAGFAEHSEEQRYAELARTAVTIAGTAARGIVDPSDTTAVQQKAKLMPDAVDSLMCKRQG